MRRMFMITRLLPLTLWMCFALLTAGHRVTQAQALDGQQLAMPEGYTLPVLPDPLPKPQGYETRDRVRLSFHGRDLVVHRLPLDTTPLNWTDDMLTLVVGMPGEDRGWQPGARYQVYPVGPPGHGHDQRAMALLGDELVVFAAPLRGQPPQPYPSVNQVGYTIALAGHQIVVTKENTRRWYFQTLDFGATWQLDRMELLHRPGQYTRLIRDENHQLVTIELPNSRRFEFTHAQNRIIALRDPFGQETQIKYDPAGCISQVDQFTSDAPDGKARYRTASYTYAYDESQRLATFQDDRRMSWTCLYQQQESIGSSSPTSWSYHTRITSSEGDCLFQQMEARRDGHFARLIGAADRQTSVPAAIQQYTFAQQVVMPWDANPKGKGAQPNARQRDTRKASTTTEEEAPLKSGLAPWLTDGWPHALDDFRFSMLHLPWPRDDDQAEPKDHKTADAPRLTRDTAGRIIKADHFDFIRDADHQPSSQPITTFHYTYSPTGDLTEAHLQDQRNSHRFTTDSWGRIIQHSRPDESYSRWLYDELGRLSEYHVAQPLPKDPRDLFAQTQFQITTTRFTYDPFGRLLRQHTDGQAEEKFIYNQAGQLISHMAAGPATLVRYRYDRLGGMIQQDLADGSREEFTYYTDGRLMRHDQRPRNERWVLRSFDPRGNITSEHIENLGKTQYEYDDLNRQSRIIHPTGKDTRYTYDDLNRITSIRGSAQPAADIQYDADGQRIVTSPR